jgi:hypothetical protein
MPIESARRIGKKKIKTPRGDVWIPVIIEIEFQDDTDRAQEYLYTVDNANDAERSAHVAWIGAKGSTTATEEADPSTPAPANLLAVERCDIWRHIDATDRHWETNVYFDNKTFDKDGPPFFTTHEKTHIVSYKANPLEPDSPKCLDSELIDEFVIIGERGQEHHFILRNAIDDDAANSQIDENTQDVTDQSGEIDPPVRTDPFQNLVRITPRKGIFLAGDSWGNLYGSTDGFQWSSAQTEMGDAISRPVYGNGQWMIYGGAYVDQSATTGQAWRSSNGFDWVKEWDEEKEAATPLADFQHRFFGAPSGVIGPVDQLNQWVITKADNSDLIVANPFPTIPPPTDEENPTGAGGTRYPHEKFGFLHQYEIDQTPNYYGYKWGEADEAYDFVDHPTALPNVQGADVGGTVLNGDTVFLRRTGDNAETIEATKDAGETWETVLTNPNTDPLFDFNIGFAWIVFGEPGELPQNQTDGSPPEISFGSIARGLDPDGSFFFGNFGYPIHDLTFGFGGPKSINGGVFEGGTGATMICAYTPSTNPLITDAQLINAIETARGGIRSLMLAGADNPSPSIAFWTRNGSGNPNGEWYDGSQPDQQVLPGGIIDRAIAALNLACDTFIANPRARAAFKNAAID